MDEPGAPGTEAALRAAYVAEHAAAEHLRDIDAWRTAFLATATHDLRSPLAGLRAHAETLLERADELTDEQRSTLLRRIITTSDKLSAQLDDLLDLDRAARREGQLRVEAVALRPLVTDVVADLDADERHVEVVDHGAPVVPVDRDRLQQAIEHLVGNALTHTPDGTTVTVTLAEHAGGVRLVVEDDGPGVPEAVRDRLFAPLVSLPPEGQEDRHRGLGLSIVDLCARLHGGTVEHEDRPGGGSRFVVDLPGSREVDV